MHMVLKMPIKEIKAKCAVLWITGDYFISLKGLCEHAHFKQNNSKRHIMIKSWQKCFPHYWHSVRGIHWWSVVYFAQRASDAEFRSFLRAQAIGTHIRIADDLKHLNAHVTSRLCEAIFAKTFMRKSPFDKSKNIVLLWATCPCG